MPLYCYIDLTDGTRFTSTQHGLERTENVRRDYQSENVNTGVAVDQLRREREWKGDPSDFVMTRTDAERKAIQNLAASGQSKESITEGSIRREADRVVSDWNNTHSAEKKGGSDKYRPRTSDGRFSKV